MLNQPLTDIRGIGTKRAQALEKLGIKSAYDLIMYLPRGYKDFSAVTPCFSLQCGEFSVLVRIAASPRIAYVRKGLNIVRCMGHDETGRISIIFYNRPYTQKSISAGKVYLVSGKVEMGQGGYQFINPEMELAENAGDDVQTVRGILPVYALVAGVTQRIMRTAVRSVIDYCNQLEEPLPEKFREKYNLCGLAFALRNVHFPLDMQCLEKAKHRMMVEEMLFYMLAVDAIGKIRRNREGIAFSTKGLLDNYIKKLNFKPTDAQMRVMLEVAEDMAKRAPMNRLIQGDVGCGKTVIAMLCAYIAAENGYQGVILAPTEILAMQHYETAKKIFGSQFELRFLAGSLSQKRKNEIYNEISDGTCNIVIGTHALIQKGVEFKNLGAVVADEQHKFGVKQRAAIMSKGIAPDCLIMSATPIPRTLTLILYGDLDLSIIDQMPAGRKKIQTGFVPHFKREDMYKFVKEQAALGNQTYIVCPMIEQSEMIEAQSAQELFEELKSGILKEIEIELLHGKLSSDDKVDAIERFKSGSAMVMVSTTVVEVGVDVANATIMIVENANRFGLAQLHQLRGRVGRGDKQSYCFLLSGEQTNDNERLKILCKSDDGFVIAEEDLKLRGPGEFLGTRQSGEGEFRIAHLIGDVELLKLCRDMVDDLTQSIEFEDCREQVLMQMDKRYEGKIAEIALN